MSPKQIRLKGSGFISKLIYPRMNWSRGSHMDYSVSPSIAAAGSKSKPFGNRPQGFFTHL